MGYHPEGRIWGEDQGACILNLYSQVWHNTPEIIFWKPRIIPWKARPVLKQKFIHQLTNIYSIRMLGTRNKNISLTQPLLRNWPPSDKAGNYDVTWRVTDEVYVKGLWRLRGRGWVRVRGYRRLCQRGSYWIGSFTLVHISKLWKEVRFTSLPSWKCLVYFPSCFMIFWTVNHGLSILWKLEIQTPRKHLAHLWCSENISQPNQTGYTG